MKRKGSFFRNKVERVEGVRKRNRDAELINRQQAIVWHFLSLSRLSSPILIFRFILFVDPSFDFFVVLLEKQWVAMEWGDSKTYHSKNRALF